MKLERIVLKLVEMPLRFPFETSLGKLVRKDFILVCAYGGGECGYGESVAMPIPTYNEETTGTVWYMLENYLIPALQSASLDSPEQAVDVFSFVRRNYMAKAALEGALWDLDCKQKGISLSSALGGKKTEIEVGVSLGIEPMPNLMKKIDRYLAEGYQRIKIKIKPGWDREPIQAIREQFGMIPLMADANSSYTPDDFEDLKALDPYGLMMIEQPLGYDDLIDHAKLQKQLKTPICLDESIVSLEAARKAIELGSCQVINLKIGRVGGLTVAKQIHDLCWEEGIPLWCGGMLEAGIGRAHNIAITSLPNFVLPGDTSASDRYWEEDLVEPEVKLAAPGKLAVPNLPGIGYELNLSVLNRYLIKEQSFTIPSHTK